MSWPVPNSGGGASASVKSGGALAPLPWAGREAGRAWAPTMPALTRSQQQQLPRGRNESIRKAKYGVAMLAGLAAVGLTKKIINSIPIVNIVSRPVLDLLPTYLVGPALGAGLYYGHEKGDPLAALPVVREKAAVARRELDSVVRDLGAEVMERNRNLARQLERSQGMLESSARAAAQSVAEMERTVVPALEREYRVIEAQTRKVLQDNSAGGGGGGHR